jgi:hypothetical protein
MQKLKKGELNEMPEPIENKDLTVEQIQLKTIEDLKTKMDGMVDPVEFKKLQDQYKTLMDDYVNKRPVPEKKTETLRPTKEIAKELASIKSGDISNRDYIKTALEYRKSHIFEFGTDPFSDFGQHGPGEANAETEEVASKLQTLLDENESPVDFRIKLNSVLKDDQQLISILNKKNKK